MLRNFNKPCNAVYDIEVFRHDLPFSNRKEKLLAFLQNDNQLALQLGVSLGLYKQFVSILSVERFLTAVWHKSGGLFFTSPEKEFNSQPI